MNHIIFRTSRRTMVAAIVSAMFLPACRVEAQTPLPTAEEFDSALRTCAIGAKISISGAVEGTLSDLYKKEKDKVGGIKANDFVFNNKTDFLEQFTSTDKPKMYELYVRCIRDILHISGQFDEMCDQTVAQNLGDHCDFDDTKRNIALSTGQSTTWECLALRAGNYAVSFGVSGSTPRPSRVNYTVSIIASCGKVIKLTSPEVADINYPSPRDEALFPSSFKTNDETWPLPQGPVKVQLSIAGVYWNMDFRNGNAWPVQLDSKVNIHLTRVN